MSFRSAGAHRAPAALLLSLALLSTGPVWAHGPVRRQPQVEPPPGSPIPPAEPLDPAALPGRPTSPTGVVATTGVLTLSQLAADSTIVASGVVTRSDSLDEDKLRVAWVRVDRVLKGDVSTEHEIGVVEIRSVTVRPPLLADGARGVLFLRPAPPLSYLTQHLPEGSYLALTGGRDGIVPLASAADLGRIEPQLTEALRIGALKDDAEIASARRALAFAELGTGHARLAADALVALRHLDPSATPTADEVAVLGRALTNRDVSAQTRIGLIQLAGDRGWKAALPAVRGATVDTPATLDAVLAARAKLGAPADKAELREPLASKDPAVRAAAIRALAALPAPSVGDLGHFATSDGDVGVRVTAIEALGTTKLPAAVPTLSQTFGESKREVRQASGRALLAIGGGAASDAFINLALHGGDADTRKYAALLLLVSNGRESPAVRRLMDSNPSGEVRDLLVHGLQWQHSHQHQNAE